MGQLTHAMHAGSSLDGCRDAGDVRLHHGCQQDDEPCARRHVHAAPLLVRLHQLPQLLMLQKLGASRLSVLGHQMVARPAGHPGALKGGTLMQASPYGDSSRDRLGPQRAQQQQDPFQKLWMSAV